MTLRLVMNVKMSMRYYQHFPIVTCQIFIDSKLHTYQKVCIALLGYTDRKCRYVFTFETKLKTK